jgi:hypothetical protein
MQKHRSSKADGSDKNQGTELLSVIDQAEKVKKVDVKNNKGLTTQLLALAAQHDAKTSDIQPTWKSFAPTKGLTGTNNPVSFALKAKLPRNEWDKVFPSGEPRAVLKWPYSSSRSLLVDPPGDDKQL